MLKKGLIKTCVFEYLDENKIKDPQSLFNHLPHIFRYLKQHKHHGNVLGDIPFNIFARYVEHGYRISHMKNIFNVFR